tara:strand:+ start:917 stop:1099 length:183 start_codon:yes stop_codon:yes gene_type:complete
MDPMKKHFEFQKYLQNFKKQLEAGKQRKIPKRESRESMKEYYDKNKSYQNPRKAGLDKTT